MYVTHYKNDANDNSDLDPPWKEQKKEMSGGDGGRINGTNLRLIRGLCLKNRKK